MKQGTSLKGLAQEIERQADVKLDYIADTAALRVEHFEDLPLLVLDGHGAYGINDTAHHQIGEKLGIPYKYYDRLRAEAPALLESNVNHWFANTPEQRMIRTLDGKVRAFLSNRYRPLDNHDLAEAVLPQLAASGASVHSCEITESRMYIKAVIDGVQVTVPPPDGHRQTTNVVISPGIVVSNSEIGQGALAVQPAVHFLACTNMAVWAQHALRKYHTGRTYGTGGGGGGEEDIWEFLSDETRQLTDAAVWSQVRDLVKGALEGPIFEKIVADLRAARGDAIAADRVTNAIERLSDRKAIGKQEQSGVLAHLIEGGDLSRFGLSNALTRFSQDVEDYDRATFFEQVGGEIIALSRTDWGSLVN